MLYSPVLVAIIWRDICAPFQTSPSFPQAISDRDSFSRGYWDIPVCGWPTSANRKAAISDLFGGVVTAQGNSRKSRQDTRLSTNCTPDVRDRRHRAGEYAPRSAHRRIHQPSQKECCQRRSTNPAHYV